MLISADLSTDKTDILTDKYTQLLNSGISSNKILVLVQNSKRKQYFTDKVFEKLSVNCIEKLQIHSFNSLVYNTINDNWAVLENLNPYDNPTILPNLTGLEVSQFLLKEILQDIQFKGYNSKKSLLHQMFRRYSLIVQNNLSDDDVNWRSDILKESFAQDAKSALKKLLEKTLYLRGFDYLRQNLLFNYIYKNTDYFKDIEYLILDDGDEITPICFDFIEFLKPQLKDVFIAYDEHGASRAGYLSADRTAVWKFEELFDQKPQALKSDNKMNSDAQILFDNILSDNLSLLNNFSINSLSKRAVMVDECITKVKKLLSNNVKPSEISIITPIIDDMLKFTLKENISTNIVFLSGSEKLIQNKLVKSVLTILKLSMKIPVSEFDLRVVLSRFLNIRIKYCKDILENFKISGKLIDYEFEFDDYNEKYKNFKTVLNDLSQYDIKLSDKVYIIYDKLAQFYTINTQEISKFNFFIKQLQEFEDVFKSDFSSMQEKIITDIENSIISENPYSVEEISLNDLIVSTPQKIIDNQVRTKYQFWLDTSSSEWIKADTGPLYNAWVFQRGWKKSEFTIDDNIELSKEKTARILRKLTLCAKEHIYTYSSLFDGNGIENFGGIQDYIKIAETEKIENVDEKQFKITPRDDQKPVLEYKSGRMAISAVPGAGKTTILLLLILKLLEEGVEPENIFVMTYMESAARNFRDKIKSINKNSTHLPNISTIHGLALRILKDNGNFERLGLNPDFEICDDSQKSRITELIGQKLKLKKTEIQDFERAVSVFKISGGNFDNIKDSKIAKFKIFYDEYQRMLSESNLIDYDDMLLSSVRLLQDNADIREYYQDICQYIIEDEAQDSSSIQQKLINILSAKHKNLIRCGDINQAITTTFSNADVKGFRDFINNSNSVKMDCSQRCTQDVWQLANNLVHLTKSSGQVDDAFFEIYMKPTGKNPQVKNALHSRIFTNPIEEKNYVLTEIKKVLDKNPKSTIGILLRSNKQVASWTDFINNSGLKTITRSECLEQKAIYRVIFAVMQMILNPFDNNVIADGYEVLSELGFYAQRLSPQIREYKMPFVEADFDNIDNYWLSRFQLDLSYWLSCSHLAPEELAVKIGLYYFTSDIEKSNVYLISTLIKRLSMNYSDFSQLLQRFEMLAKKPSLSGFKFFSQEDESNREFLKGKIQIMTLHKSKGDEFDYVFIPELSEDNLALDLDNVQLKASDFMENVRNLNPDYKTKSEIDVKKDLLCENLRLMYVGITRAQKYLYFTVSKQYKSWGKLKEHKPSMLFDTLLKDCEREVQVV